MPYADPMVEINQKLATKINEEARRDPQSPYANKFVGIANGKVVVVSDDFEDMIVRLRQIEPNPAKTMGVDASEDPNEVHDIWRLR